MDQPVRNMLKGMGIKNGTAFFQALPYNGKIYFHEMGYRLSGGMLFKLTEPLTHVNDMKMMIRFALGGPTVTDEELAGIDLSFENKAGAQLMIPLDVGTIGRIEGLEEVKALPEVVDFIQYYHEGETMERRFVGTLSQHFGRFSLLAENEDALISAVLKIQKLLTIYDTEGKRMNNLVFDVNRAK